MPATSRAARKMGFHECSMNVVSFIYQEWLETGRISKPLQSLRAAIQPANDSL